MGGNDLSFPISLEKLLVLVPLDQKGLFTCEDEVYVAD
jgi:hypothetical protein